jgi:hypothetical protein
MSLFSSFKFWMMMGIAIGLGFAAWYAIKTWRDDIRKMVFEELFADLVEQENKKLAGIVKTLREDFEAQKKIYEEEKKNREKAKNQSTKIDNRTKGLPDGKPSPRMRETMKVIYELQNGSDK